VDKASGDPFSADVSALRSVARAGLTRSGLVASNTRLFADRRALARVPARAGRERWWSQIQPRRNIDGRSERFRQRQPPCHAPVARGFAGNNSHGNQTYLPALRGQAQAHARLSGSHEIARRTRGPERAPRQGPQAPGGLNQGRPTAAFAFSRARRLQSEAEFAAVAQAGPDAIRLSQRWFVLIAKPVATTPAAAAQGGRRVRFGLTVGKRLARRSMDRILIKRILREAARHSAPQLDAVAHADMDVVLRLKAPLPAPDLLPRGQLKRALRADADAVLKRLAERLTGRANERANEQTRDRATPGNTK